MDAMSTQEQQLCEFLKTLPRVHHNRYTKSAEADLIRALFWSLARGQPEYFRLFFPETSRPSANTIWKLRKAQGGADGDEFTEAARGKACGHIFKSGEATYRCKTCSADDTCVLCSRCYDSSDHTGHMVYVSVSLGNSGCCDCGDPEAWRLPVHCSIHTPHNESAHSKDKGKAPILHHELVEAIRMTIGRVCDYICDVASCSPEQLRLPKSRETILLDERMSRLTSKFYNGDIVEEPCEYALLLWNDEKHTVYEVQDQVARACKVRAAEGLKRAHETDDIGRSIVKYSFDIDELLKVSKIIEHIKVTVTIRSARDTFREQMCGSLVEWLSDIAGCSVGEDHNILRQVVCEELLKVWSTGSEASNAGVGLKGIDDHQTTERAYDDELDYRQLMLLGQRRALAAAAAAAAEDSDSLDGDDDGTNVDDDEDIDLDREMGVPTDDEGSDDGELDDVERSAGWALSQRTDADGDVDMVAEDGEASPMEEFEATNAGYPPPPPPPPAPTRPIRDRDITPSDSDTAEMQPLISHNVYAKANLQIPKTPGKSHQKEAAPRPPRYWLETPAAYNDRDSVQLHEDLTQRLRLDWMILFDLRMWKKLRVDLRDLYISTVVTIPEFKRVLGLRFAGLYTTLAQLYLIADREPDHSIINISLQMLTTPSITAEIVERGNFLTNLMAILYTFLTTRQVGHPYEINPNATLAFDSGSVTNRRMYHFFMDLRYLFASEHVQEKLRTEERYMLQFLDLVKLHQGICPNTRAIGEHVEYETDAWISASLITREINRLCRQFSESFKWNANDDQTPISNAIRLAAKAVILNSLGTERRRFVQAEIKDEIKFKKVGDYEFDTTDTKNEHSVVKFVVESQPISFHHALHYTLSWLIECGKSMPREKLQDLLSFTVDDLLEKPKAMGTRYGLIQNYGPEDHLMAAFDFPLRVCAWLAQMKAGMWVRNGMSLRHQMGTYRGVSQRDVSHHRDIFLLQTAMVVCSPSRVLVSMIDRYGLELWMKGIFAPTSDGLEDAQTLDVVEDMIHLLIVLISDRTSLVSTDEDPSPHVLAMRRDIIHVLCFKPLSFSDICGKLPDKFQDQEECQDILDEMTTFKAPEGLSDTGHFELKEQFMEDIDPYIAHYNKNQREESENAYRTWMAKKSGRPAADIVFEPKLRPVESGAFADLSAFTRTGIFAQIIYYSLLYPLKAQEYTRNVPVTRVETFLQVVLHLVLIAIAEDKTDEDEMSEESLQSFVYIALTSTARSNFTTNAQSWKTIAAVLELLSRKDEYKACHTKIALVLKRMKQKRPRNFETAFMRLGVPVDRISTASPASNNVLEEREKKKQAALERQAKVMAQFQQQQKKFLDNQGDIDWGEEDVSDDNLEEDTKDQKSYWQFPASTCILCQEETKDGRLYGTFALMNQSTILRETDFQSPDFIREVTKTPSSLDRSAESIRPFGVAGENREQVHKITASGVEIVTERQYIGKGFPKDSSRIAPVSVSCGHIMHYKCFEVYIEATQRRHQHQIARHHPENLFLNEFVCPLCKALGNAFLPIIWGPKEELPIAHLQPQSSFENFLDVATQEASKVDPNERKPSAGGSNSVELFMQHDKTVLVNTLSSKLSELLIDAWEPTPSTPALLIAGPGEIRSATPAVPAAPWADNAAGPSATSIPAAVSPMHELVGIYCRLNDTMAKNELASVHPKPANNLRVDSPKEIRYSDTLARMLGISISSVEIQQRGIANVGGVTFIESLPQQAVTHLKILAETASSYVSIGGLKAAGDNPITREFCAVYECQQRQLFLRGAVLNDPLTSIQTATEYESNTIRGSLLSQDMFLFLTEASLCLAQVEKIPIMHLVQLCYMAEIVKVVLKLGRNKGSSHYMETIGFDPSEHTDIFQSFCTTIYHHDRETGIVEDGPGTGLDQPCFSSVDAIRSFVKKYALAYLRKVTLLLYVRYGVVFSSQVSGNPDKVELDRLTEALHLPAFDQMCALLVENQGFNAFIRGWIIDSKIHDKLPLTLPHPAIFELIGLPKNYDTLMEETMKRRCPTTGKDVSDPMLCLFCGIITCGQGICCLKPGPADRNGRRQDIGGAQQHMLKCQKNIGLFINIRKCCVYYVHHQSGSWMVAPYVDKYGEVDPGLRHSRQLFLNQKRYDALLRTVWLGHGVPSVISRKLEMDINNGGWETI